MEINKAQLPIKIYSYPFHSVLYLIKLCISQTENIFKYNTTLTENIFEYNTTFLTV